MKKILPVCFIFMLILIDCASVIGYQMKTVHDEFDGYTKNIMTHNPLSGGGLFGATVHLCVQRFQSKNGQIIYHLIIQYIHEDWLFIQGGESLVLLIDGQRFGFTGEGSSRHRDVTTMLGEAMVIERAYYETAPEYLKKIASAKEIKVKIIGSQFYIERQFSGTNIDNFKRFVKDYVEGG